MDAFGGMYRVDETSTAAYIERCARLLLTSEVIGWQVTNDSFVVATDNGAFSAPGVLRGRVTGAENARQTILAMMNGFVPRNDTPMDVEVYNI